MNPFRKIANSLMNWWKGETAPEVSDSTELTGGVMTLNSPSFLESMGLSRRRKTTSEVTYFTCLKMLSETLAKMPIKYYQRTDKGIIEAEQTDTSRLLTKRPNPFMTPTVFWNTVEINRNHYGNAYVYMRKKFIRKKYGGEVKILDLWVMQSNCVQIVVDDAGIFAGKGRLWYVYTDPTSGSQYVFDTSEVMHFKTSFAACASDYFEKYNHVPESIKGTATKDIVDAVLAELENRNNAAAEAEKQRIEAEKQDILADLDMYGI